MKRPAIQFALILGAVITILTAAHFVQFIREVNYPPPNRVPISQYQVTAANVSLNVRVDEKLYFDADSMGSIFYGEVSEFDRKQFELASASSAGGKNTVLMVHRIGEETLVGVGRPNDRLVHRFRELVTQETSRHKLEPRKLEQDILDSDSYILGVKFGLTTTIDLTKRFGQPHVTDGSREQSLQTWNLKGLVIATDGRTSSFTGGAKVDLVAAMAWSGSLNEALAANDLAPLPGILGKLKIGQSKPEIKKLLKVSPRDGGPEKSRLMIRQAGENNIFGWVMWNEEQTLRSIQFSDSWD